MLKLDERRLTGFNVIWKNPSAVIDVALDTNEDAQKVIELWHQEARRLLDAVGWKEQRTASHSFATGVSLALSGPIDALYAAVELAQWAYQNLEAAYLGRDSQTQLEDLIVQFNALVNEERNPQLLELEASAKRHNKLFLWDDDEVSVGLGKGSRTWPVGEIPNQVDWSSIHSVPVGMVTGTNGKTTSVRLSQHILRTGGMTVGISSTDWIAVDDDIIDRGDYSGPGGARAVLRRHSADAVILETARGGLLRRGLGTPRADAALITNIAEDHLGDFGSQNLQELLDLKWIVTKALDRDSFAILNADDEMLVEKSTELEAPIIWFGLDPANPVLQQHIKEDGLVFTVIDQQLQRYDGSNWHSLGAIKDIPMTLNGTAKHNIANALGAAALCKSLGCKDQTVIDGLTSMPLDSNPGRCNFFSIDGREVLLDFAHNPSAMSAIFEMASHHPAKRRRLCFGQAGDRTDQLILDLAALAWGIGLEHVYISELADYYRGREAGEVFSLLSQGLTNSGARIDQITHCELELDALTQALEQSQPGDLIIMLALGESRKILEKLKELTQV